MIRPSILLNMTDEERHPPPFGDAATKKFRTEQLGALATI